MAKLFKILMFLLIFIVLAVAGLSIFIRYYLTEERLKAVIVPQAEKALGRKVELDSIKVSLLKGITITDFAIKEEDEKEDFLRAKEFVFRYDLMPLLQKKIVVSQIKIIKPEIKLVRYKNGRFNYESLRVLKTGEANSKSPKTPSTAEAAALPLALTIDSIVVEDAHIAFTDEKKELPRIDAKADCSLSLDMGADIKSMRYAGKAGFEADIKYEKVSSAVTGNIKFDTDRAEFDILAGLDDQRVRLVGDVKNYLQTPNAHIDISSDELNIDKLLALVAAIPSASKQESKPQPETTHTSKPGEAIPHGLKVEGKISIGKILYQPYEIESFGLKYLLKDGKIFVQDISAKLLGKDLQGTMTGHGSADLTSMVGGFTLESLDLDVQGIKAQVAGKTSFDSSKIELNFNVAFDSQKARIVGEIKNYTTAPNVKLDITSDEIDANKLLAITAALPKAKAQAGSSQTKTSPKESEAIELPKGLKAQGTIRVSRLLYKKLIITDLLIKYRLIDGVLFIDEFSAKTSDGYIRSRSQAVLTKKRIPFKGDVKIKGINLPKLLQGLESPMAGKLSGFMEAEFVFSGTGIQWDYLQNTLNVEGKYLLRDGTIKGVKAINSIAELLGLPSLKNVDFNSLDGTVHVSNGKVQLKTVMSGRELSARAKGLIGLDGSLDLPLTLTLSEHLSKKLIQKSGYAKYLTNQHGKVELNIKLAGTVKSPRPSIDTSGVKKKVKKKIKKRVVKELGKFLGKSKGKNGANTETEGKKITPKNLIKGLWGK